MIAGGWSMEAFLKLQVADIKAYLFLDGRREDFIARSLRRY